MPIVTANHVEKAFATRRVLEDVSLALEAGEHVGLIGSNGSGKSTLGKILCGLELADGGTVARRRDLDMSYLAQEPVLDATLTAYGEVEKGLSHWHEAIHRHEAISGLLARGEGDQAALLSEQESLAASIEQLGGWNQSHRVREMLEHLGIARPDQPVSELSGGERRRVALARILVSRPGLCVLDEPTNHLDADTSEWLESHLREQFDGALLLITHDRYFLDSVVSRVLEIDRGRLYSFEGNYARYLDLKADRLAHEDRVESNRLNVLRREREWLAHKAPARTTKQKARIHRAQDLEERVQKSRRSSDGVDFRVASTRSAQRIVEVKQLTKRFGSNVLFEKLDLVLSPGMRVGVIGKNGAGKSTLLNVMLGREAPSGGEVVWGPNTATMYFDQHRAGLDDDKSVFENVYEGSDKIRLGDTYVSIYTYLDRFLFDSAKQRQAAGSLSGGERARLALAKMLRGGANLIILDEPTNDLDLVTLATLEDLLVGFGGAALMVTHDRYFLNRTATSILSFEGDGKVVQYAGHYDDYRLQRAAADLTREVDAVPERRVPADEARARKPRAGLSLGEEKELQGLSERIDAAERDVAALEVQLNDPALYASRGAEVTSLREKLNGARAMLDGLMARWEVLENKKGAGA